FEEVTSDNLLKVSLDGTVLEGSEYSYNKTDYIIHENGHFFYLSSTYSCYCCCISYETRINANKPVGITFL
ncbi:unnamed protein product, partial [Oppiella nova]